MRCMCCQCGKLSQKCNFIVIPKNSDTLKKWIRLYNLRLTIATKDNEHYLCREHVNQEKKPEKLGSSILYKESKYDDPLISDVKQEQSFEEEDEERSITDCWETVKDEPVEEVSFDEISFAMKQNCNEEYEDSGNDLSSIYDINQQQPTTSSASTSAAVIQRCRTNIAKPIELENMPIYFPELSDNEVMSFCVKTSNNISGLSVFECGMCEEEYFNDMNTKSIRYHLHKKHYSLIKTYIQTGTAPLAPKTYSPLSHSTKVKADQALCAFLVKNGLPLRTVQDRNLEMLAFNMNSEYTLPTVDVLFKYLQEIAAERTNSKINTNGGPVTITFDTTTFNNRNYLAFTLHYYQMKSHAKQCIFLREIENAQPTVSSIMSVINKALEESDIRSQITTVVAGKAEFEDALEAMGCFKQVMVCFSQNINKFAESLIAHPVFAVSLKKLRDFISKFPTNRNLWSKFKSYIIRKRTYGEYPEVDNGHWYTTLDFITKCLHMHRLISEFVLSNSQLKYISVEDNINIVYLRSLLDLCKSVQKQLVVNNATIAEVIPTVIEIEQSLIITTSNETVVAAVKMIFGRWLLPFVDQSDIHRFALFLHPLHHGSSHLSEEEWNTVTSCLARHLSLREATERTSSAASSLVNTVSVDKEVSKFSAYVCQTNGVESSVIDWWDRHSAKFPRLYNYARELFQIPAFSIDASFYLGDYGLLTHSVNETEITKRKVLLQASSELVEYRSKGDVMCKPICVKRRKDAACPEDMWYHPVDMKSLQVNGQQNHEFNLTPRLAPHRRAQLMTPNHFPPSSFHNSYYPPSVGRPNFRPTKEVPFGRSFKEEIAKLGTVKPKTQKVYTVATPSPYNKPFIRKEEVDDNGQMPVVVKKYYAVRTVPSNGSGVIRGKNGQLLQVIRSRPSLASNSSFVPRPNIRSSTGKVYFVRSKTGVTHQLPSPSL